MSLHKRRAKFLVDFDGVWTDIAGQAKSVDKARIEELTNISGFETSFIEKCLMQVHTRIMQTPHLFGWHSDGRISAFADEDPFLLHNATVEGVGILAVEGPLQSKECLGLKKRLEEKGHIDLGKLGSDIFHVGCNRYLAESGHTPLPGAMDALRELSDLVDVVICTNFTTDLVASTLSRHGFHLQAEDGTSRLKLKGLARKNMLTADSPEGSRQAVFGDRSIWIDRGHYKSIILEEMPDVVVGDVFSLDLALPLVLQSENEALKDLNAYLMLTPFSSSWAKDLTQNNKIPQLKSITHPKELVQIANALSLATSL
ncbi:MAG: hypothetical protein HQK51_07775 [Oligoflexia bacterium]|nr:hypothetical protein [Oligoflexia bacterium]